MGEPKKYRKLPVEIEAMQWTGDNEAEIQAWAGRHRFYENGEVVKADGKVFTASLWVQANAEWLGIETGEWVAKDSAGFYPIKPDLFARTYEPVDDAEVVEVQAGLAVAGSGEGVPVFMRIGDGDEHEVGRVHPTPDSTEGVPVADLLRGMADTLDSTVVE